MKHATIFSTAALCLLLSFNVSAAYIVDTGPGRPALLLSQEQWLAAEFTLDQAYTITGIEGWLQYFAGTSSSFAPFDISIYADGGDIPDAGNRIFNAIFSTGVPPQPVDWYGRAGGLSLDLSAGTYWLAFEMDGSRVPPEYGYGDMPPTPTQVLANYAVWNPTTGSPSHPHFHSWRRRLRRSRGLDVDERNIRGRRKNSVQLCDCHIGQWSSEHHRADQSSLPPIIRPGILAKPMIKGSDPLIALIEKPWSVPYYAFRRVSSDS